MEPIKKLNSYINSAIPYAWDDSESWFEFLAKVLQKVNEVVEASNDYFAVDLQEYVTTIVTTWKTDGTLDRILSDAVLDFKLDVSKYNDDMSIINNQLYNLKMFVNVKEYGATGDGAIDDTAAIQSALTAGAGKTVVFPQGTYNVTSLSAPANTTIIGYGAKVINDTAHATILTLASGVTLLGLEIEGMGNASYEPNGKGIVISGSYADSVVTYAENISIRDCNIHDMGANGVYATYAKNILVEHCVIERIGYAGVAALNSDGFDVLNSTVNDISPGSTDAYGVIFSSQSYSLNLVEFPPSQNCSVVNCRISNNALSEGLDTHGGRNISFVNNTITGCRVGVTITWVHGPSGVAEENYASENCIVSGNRITGISTGVGISVAGGTSIFAKNIEVSGNILNECGQEGNDLSGAIVHVNTKNAVISNNVMNECYIAGVALYHDNYGVSVTGNVVKDTQSAAKPACGITIRSVNNTGVISANSFLLENAALNTKVGECAIWVWTAALNGLDLTVGPQFSTFTVFGVSLSGQGINFGQTCISGKIHAYTDTPESAITAGIGSLCFNTVGGAGTTMYLKESGKGNTGWKAIVGV